MSSPKFPKKMCRTCYNFEVYGNGIKCSTGACKYLKARTISMGGLKRLIKEA